MRLGYDSNRLLPIFMVLNTALNFSICSSLSVPKANNPTHNNPTDEKEGHQPLEQGPLVGASNGTAAVLTFSPALDLSIRNSTEGLVLPSLCLSLVSFVLLVYVHMG